MEQMELREALAEVKDSSDAMASLDTMLDDIRSRVKTTQLKLSNLLEELSNENLLSAKTIIQEMQFLFKLQHEAEELEEELVNSL